MSPAELHRQVARVTGESIRAIREHGFQPLSDLPPEEEPIDWDQLATRRNTALFEQPIPKHPLH